ncbi:MAG: methyltransferase domain-containing protein [Acidimicrobiales bacterium]|nr:methyltransferase domain-containing protein [Acidimicrobiales bacterium]
MAPWDGSEYRKVNGLQHWLADRAMSELDLDGVHSLLDVGCGDGRITATIADRLPGATVIGIDPSPRMVSVAPSSDAVSFLVGDVCSMTFDGAFDVVVSFNALHWVLDQHGALTRIASALRRPGRALLVLVCAGERPSLEHTATRVAGAESWRRYFTDFSVPFAHPTPTAWAEMVSDCGLTASDTVVDDLSWDFVSTDAFAAWCTVGFGAWTERLPSDCIGPFVADVIRAYEATTGSSQILRFLQLRARLEKASTVGRSH